MCDSESRKQQTQRLPTEGDEEKRRIMRTTLGRTAQTSLKSHLKSSLGLSSKAAIGLVNGFSLMVSAAAVSAISANGSAPTARRSTARGKAAVTGAKRGRGRPKGSKNAKSASASATASGRVRPGSPDAINRAKARKSAGLPARGRLDAPSMKRFNAALAIIAKGGKASDARSAAKAAKVPAEKAAAKPKRKKAAVKRTAGGALKL